MKRLIMAVALVVCAPVAHAGLYKCGNEYQDHPCSGDLKEGKIKVTPNKGFYDEKLVDRTQQGNGQEDRNSRPKRRGRQVRY